MGVKIVLLLVRHFIGPSGVRALPVAAGTNLVAPIVGIIFLLSLSLILLSKGRLQKRKD